MTVYVVQDQQCVDRSTGKLKSKFDFSPAEKYGRLQFLLRPSASPFNLQPVLRSLHDQLQHFDAETDYLLLTGNPVLLGLAVSITADYTDGVLRLLQWSGAKRDYIVIHADNIFEAIDE